MNNKSCCDEPIQEWAAAKETRAEQKAEKRQRMIKLHLFVVEREREADSGEEKRNTSGTLRLVAVRRGENKVESKQHQAEANSVVLKVTVIDESQRRIE